MYYLETCVRWYIQHLFEVIKKQSKKVSYSLSFCENKQILITMKLYLFSRRLRKVHMAMLYKTGYCHFCQSDSFIQLTQIMMTNLSGSYQNLFKPRSDSGKFQKIFHSILVKWITLTNQRSCTYSINTYLCAE